VSDERDEDLQDSLFPQRITNVIQQRQLLSYQQSKVELLGRLAIHQKLFEEGGEPTTVPSLTEAMPKS